MIFYIFHGIIWMMWQWQLIKVSILNTMQVNFSLFQKVLSQSMLKCKVCHWLTQLLLVNTGCRLLLFYWKKIQYFTSYFLWKHSNIRFYSYKGFGFLHFFDLNVQIHFLCYLQFENCCFFACFCNIFVLDFHNLLDSTGKYS